MSDTVANNDRALLLAVQEGLPLCLEPYRELADGLDMAEQDVIDALARLQITGIIRRTGLVPNHYALGYRHNLMLVWNINDAEADAVGQAMGNEAFVSHCYRRPRYGDDWPYNLFTMIHCREERDIAGRIEVLRALAGAAYVEHMALKSTKILKKTGIRLTKDSNTDV